MTNQTRWFLPAATVVLALLGIGAFAAAAMTPLQVETVTGAPSAPSTSAPRPIPTLGANPGTAGQVLDATITPVAELADPGWVRRVALAGDIPERALAAYAGAALAISQADPSCGLGWNTLAAIGFVETEHGTINGSRIGEDGVARPDIIGIPLNGDGVDEIPDSDDGLLDGDSTWDRAVGPMQFIPSSWQLLGRDGDQDAEIDVHDIDDAALAAAVHLCDVGGDLTQPSNWINALNAYNSSVEYNNRVAEAANRYGSLR